MRWLLGTVLVICFCFLYWYCKSTAVWSTHSLCCGSLLWNTSQTPSFCDLSLFSQPVPLHDSKVIHHKNKTTTKAPSAAYTSYVPRVNVKSAGSRSFQCQASVVWNSLPFKAQLKHLIFAAFTWSYISGTVHTLSEVNCMFVEYMIAELVRYAFQCVFWGMFECCIYKSNIVLVHCTHIEFLWLFLCTYDNVERRKLVIF